MAPRGLVVFDFDGTLIRGQTVCELLAAPLGRLARMRELERLSSEAEIADPRAEIAGWYCDVPDADLCRGLEAVRWAPRAREGIAHLRANGIEAAIASITWEFGVRRLAIALAIERVLGTGLAPDGRIPHVWPRDKASWLRALAIELEIPAERTAAVGDSASDLELLAAAARGFFVGDSPSGSHLELRHRKDADILALAEEILDAWA